MATVTTVDHQSIIQGARVSNSLHTFGGPSYPCFMVTDEACMYVCFDLTTSSNHAICAILHVGLEINMDGGSGTVRHQGHQDEQSRTHDDSEIEMEQGGPPGRARRSLATVCNSWPAAGVHTFHSNSEPVSLQDNYTWLRKWTLGTR